jgi:hypothetical protein
MKTDLLPDLSQALVKKAIELGFTLDQSDIDFIRLDKGTGVGRLLILVGRAKTWFNIQLGATRWQTAETASFSSGDPIASVYLREDFVNLKPEKYLNRQT